MSSRIIVFSMNILVPMHLQSVPGATGLQASLVLFPAILLAVIFGPIAGKIYDSKGAKSILPLGMLLVAVFALVTSWAMGQDTLWLITVLYMPAILGSALAIGPVQSFSLSSLPRAMSPHGVTIFSTSFQIAGCVGTALSTGIYGAFVASGGGASGDAAANRGFLVVGGVLFVLALIATVLGWTGTRATASPTSPATPAEGGAQESSAPVSDALVVTLMREDIYYLSPTDTIRQALHMFVDKRISGAPLLDGVSSSRASSPTATSWTSSATRFPPSRPLTRCWRTRIRRSSGRTSRRCWTVRCRPSRRSR